MGVKYDFIDDLLKRNKLDNPHLNVLVEDHTHYRTFLYQHQGEIVVNVEGSPYVRNLDTKLAAAKHLQFFLEATSEKFDLLLTPEYSCPLVALSEYVNGCDYSNPGSLMVVGCESATLKELQRFSDTTTNENVIVLMEHDEMDSNQQKFFDPIAYVFLTKHSEDNRYVRVILFQFKTYPMGGSSIESEYMIYGKKRYIIRNDEESIFLATIICSEGLDIDLEEDLRQFISVPYLILHPQLNLSPRTSNIKQYRTNFFNNCAEDTNVEILSYNWANGSIVNGRRIDYAHSAIYTKAKEILINDKRINDNDSHGLHYNCWKDARSSVLVFDDREAIFLFSNSKVSKRRLKAQSQARFGPQMIKRFVWQNKWLSVQDKLNQQLLDYCQRIGGDFEYFFNDSMTFINQERLLAMTVGEITESGWISPNKLYLFEISNDEFSNRITLFQDPKTKNSKIEWLNKYATFSSSLVKNVNWIPENSFFEDLIIDRKIHYNPPLYNYNVLGSTGNPACIIYAGVIDPIKASELRAIMLKAHPDDNSFPQRLLIVFHHLGKLTVNYHPEAPSYTGNNNHNPTSINKTKE